MVDLAQELGSHHFVRAVLDETCNVQETCRETQEKRKQQSSLCFVPERVSLSGLNALDSNGTSVYKET